MGKKFKFKLDGLLKVREFREEKVKVELGELIKQEQDILNRLDEISKEVGVGYEMHGKAFQNTSKGRDAYFYPYFFEGKRKDRERCGNVLYVLRKKIIEKRAELAEAMGEVKILENLKEKKEKEFIKEKNKREYSDIEENVIMKFKPMRD